jgi:hypothetical protein
MLRTPIPSLILTAILARKQNLNRRRQGSLPYLSDWYPRPRHQLTTLARPGLSRPGFLSPLVIATAKVMTRKREGTMTDKEHTRGPLQGRAEAITDAIDAIQDMEDDSRSQDWNAAVKAVESRLLELMPHHR